MFDLFYYILGQIWYFNTFLINFVPPPSDDPESENDRNENARILETSKNGKLTHADVEKQTKHKNRFSKNYNELKHFTKNMGLYMTDISTFFSPPNIKMCVWYLCVIFFCARRVIHSGSELRTVTRFSLIIIGHAPFTGV